jgi:hypothetical protein
VRGGASYSKVTTRHGRELWKADGSTAQCWSPPEDSTGSRSSHTSPSPRRRWGMLRMYLRRSRRGHARATARSILVSTLQPLETRARGLWAATRQGAEPSHRQRVSARRQGCGGGRSLQKGKQEWTFVLARRWRSARRCETPEEEWHRAEIITGGQSISERERGLLLRMCLQGNRKGHAKATARWRLNSMLQLLDMCARGLWAATSQRAEPPHTRRVGARAAYEKIATNGREFWNGDGGERIVGAHLKGGAGRVMLHMYSPGSQKGYAKARPPANTQLNAAAPRRAREGPPRGHKPRSGAITHATGT